MPDVRLKLLVEVDGKTVTELDVQASAVRTDIQHDYIDESVGVTKTYRKTGWHHLTIDYQEALDGRRL